MGILLRGVPRRPQVANKVNKEMLAIPDRIAVQLVRHIPALLANVDAGNDTRLADAMRITNKNIARIRKKIKDKSYKSNIH